MRIAYLDCFSGISGDMFLGALIDSGVPRKLLEDAASGLNIGASLEISRVDRSGISATKVNVSGLNGQIQQWEPADVHPDQAHKHPHEHPDEHSHSHDDHEHNHSHSHEQRPTHELHRGLKEIRAIISRASNVSDAAKRNAVAMFEALGAAEAKIHNMDIESVHFHEVGAVDAIVDIVCASVGAEALGVDAIISSPLNLGGGTVKCAHGVFPVPAPATLELLRETPVFSSGIQAELVTPTGAAIVQAVASSFGPLPQMKLERTGYGAGIRNPAGHPNVLRIAIGESAGGLSPSIPQETIAVLEANVDDLNPQVFGYVLERLLNEGALDVFGIPVQMKKNRPGILLTVLCKPENAETLSRIIFMETSTLGLRRRDEQRLVLPRKWVSVSTQWGDVRMKVANINGTVTNYAPEYDDCRKLATDKNVPLKDVMQAAISGYGLMLKS